MSLSLSHDAAHHRSAPAGVVVAVTVTVDLIATKSYVVMNREVLCWLCVCHVFISTLYDFGVYTYCWSWCPTIYSCVYAE